MKTALVVLVVLLGSALIGALTFSAVECPECEGVSRAWPSPDPTAAVWIGCPRCQSRGTVTLVNRTKRRTLAPRATDVLCARSGLMDATSRVTPPFVDPPDKDRVVARILRSPGIEPSKRVRIEGDRLPVVP